jgi:hypothetical protein
MDIYTNSALLRPSSFLPLVSRFGWLNANGANLDPECGEIVKVETPIINRSQN